LKKNILNTVIAVSILFAFLFLANADLVHHHDDGTSHQQCQACILISLTVTTVITTSLIKLSREEICLRFIPVQDTPLVKNHFKQNHPGRAPPQNT